LRRSKRLRVKQVNGNNDKKRKSLPYDEMEIQIKKEENE